MADKAEEGAEAAEEPAAPKKAKSGIVGLLINGAGVFAVTLAAVIAGGFVNNVLHPPTTAPDYVLNPKDNSIKVFVPPPPKPEKKVEKKAKKKGGHEDAPAVFYSLDPPLVVNFEDATAVRFLQIGIDIMARDPAAIVAVTKNVPIIRNNLLLLISNRDYKKLMTREGKEELRAETLSEVRKILKKEAPDAEIENLLFTSFVVQ